MPGIPNQPVNPKPPASRNPFPPTPVTTFGGMPLNAGNFLPDIIGNPNNTVSNLEAGGREGQNGMTPRQIQAAAKAQGINTKTGLPNAASHISDMQQFLKNRGYNVTVDGVRGPQTSAAVAAFHNHISAQAFNARYGGAKAAGKTGGNSPNQALPVQTPAQHARVVAGAKAAQSPAAANTTNNTQGYNPLQLAQSEANAQYDPSITDLQNQISGATAQNTANQSSLQNWYAQMQSLLNQQLSDTQNNATQGGQAYATALGNDAQLFGGAQAPQVGAAGQNNADALSAVNQSQQDYLNNMMPLLKAQAAQGQSDASNAYQQQSGNLHSQLQAQQLAKGQTFNTDYQTALQNQAQLQQNQQALNDAQSLFPYQLASAKSQAQADASNAANASAINQVTLQKDNAQVQEVQSATQKNLAEAQAAATKGASFAPGSKDRQTLVSNLYKSMVNSAGTSVIQNPVQAQKALYTQAVAYGLLNANGQEQVPGAATALKAVLQNVLASTPSWRTAGWQWNGNTFVQTKK